MKPTKFRFNKNREITASINFCVPKLLPKSSGNIHLTNEKKTVHNDFGLRTSDFGQTSCAHAAVLSTRYNYCLITGQPLNFLQLPKPPP